MITLARSSIEPFLQFSTRRDLREKAFRAWTQRGETGGAHDNRAILREILALRQERAGRLGFANFAAFKLDDSMARTPEAVRGLLMNVWRPAVAQATREAARLQAMIASEGGNFTLAAHDWRHYAERLRQAEYDFSEAELKPYLPLERIIAAAFDTASRLFGLAFREVTGEVALYHPDVRAFEVSAADGRLVGLFLGDYFARPSKRSGAWMSAFRGQQKLDGDIRPIIVNVMNFAKAPAGEASLLTFDDARTLFHEFGHALHGLLSDVTYPMVAGTNVARDFVELPSQLYEHWLSAPELLARHAVHYRTGAPMPPALVEKLTHAATFNQGFATVEYTSSALADLELHLGAPAEDFDASAFEADLTSRLGMPQAITLRHRLPHFSHVFSGDGYSAGYYSYMWSEVMDADAFAAFEETGNVFDPATAARLLRFVYSAGGSRDPAELYTAFRGRMPDIGPMLKKRGLAG